MVKTGRYLDIPEDLYCENCKTPGTMQQVEYREEGDNLVCKYKCKNCRYEMKRYYPKSRYHVDY